MCVKFVRITVLSLRYATLDPELPRWAFLRKGLADQKWDLAGLTQAYSRPTGREKAMIYNEQSLKWERAPEPVNLPDPGKGESTEKEAKADKSVQQKRRSETEGEEPKAKKGGIAKDSGKAKPVELKTASEVSKASQEKADKDAGRAGEPAEEKSEKRPHTPRSGIVLRSAEEVQQRDAGEKAPHGDSSDEDDDVMLAENLQKVSSVTGTSRKGQEGSNGPRSVEGMYGDEPTEETSSKITVSGVDEDPYAPSQVSKITDPEEAGKRRRRASKSRLAKKAARRGKKRRSPPRSVAPRDEEEDDALDPELFENLRGVIPERDAQELLVEVTGLARGFQAQSVSARSRASRMETLMLQMGREAAAAREEAEEEKRLMRQQNNLLKRTLGLVTTHQPALAQAAIRSAGQASGSRDEDPDARSRPGSAHRK